MKASATVLKSDKFAQMGREHEQTRTALNNAEDALFEATQDKERHQTHAFQLQSDVSSLKQEILRLESVLLTVI